MRFLFEAALSNALVAALLAVAVATICRFRIRPAARHALWLIVLVKLLTPPLVRLEIPTEMGWLNTWANGPSGGIVNREGSLLEPELTLGPPAKDRPHETPSVDVSGDHSPSMAAGPVAPLVVDALPPAQWTDSLIYNAESATSAVAVDDSFIFPETPIALAAEVRDDSSSAADRLVSVFGSIWIAGSLAWFLVAGWRLWKFHRQTQRLLPADDVLQSLADEVAAEFRLKRSPLIRTTEATVPPMLTLVPNRAMIILPARLMSGLERSQQSAILAHELAHFRRGDQWMRWFEFLVVGLYWWHPAAWYARKELQAAEELCCDAWVLRVFPDQARGYAHALLAAVDFLAEAPPSAPAEACALGPISSLKQRLDMILKRKPFPELSPPAKLAMATLALIILPWAPQMMGQDLPPTVAVEAPTTPPTASPKPTPPAAPVAENPVVPAASQVLPPTAAPRVEPVPPVAEPFPPVTVSPAGLAPVPRVILTTPPGASNTPTGTAVELRPGVPRAGGTVEERLDRLEQLIEKLVAGPAHGVYGSVTTTPPRVAGTAPGHVVAPGNKRVHWTADRMAVTDRRIRELEKELDLLKRNKEALSRIDPNGLAIVVIPNENAIRAIDTSSGTTVWTCAVANPDSIQSATSDGEAVTVLSKDGESFLLDSKTGRMILGARSKKTSEKPVAPAEPDGRQKF